MFLVFLGFFTGGSAAFQAFESTFGSFQTCSGRLETTEEEAQKAADEAIAQMLAQAQADRCPDYGVFVPNRRFTAVSSCT